MQILFSRRVAIPPEENWWNALTVMIWFAPSRRRRTTTCAWLQIPRARSISQSKCDYYPKMSPHFPQRHEIYPSPANQQTFDLTSYDSKRFGCLSKTRYAGSIWYRKSFHLSGLLRRTSCTRNLSVPASFTIRTKTLLIPFNWQCPNSSLWPNAEKTDRNDRISIIGCFGQHNALFIAGWTECMPATNLRKQLSLLQIKDIRPSMIDQLSVVNSGSALVPPSLSGTDAAIVFLSRVFLQ